jgi:hypothetical protein
MKKRTPFRIVSVCVVLNQSDHCVLNEVQRFIIVSSRDLRHPQGSTFDPCQKTVDRMSVIQDGHTPVQAKAVWSNRVQGILGMKQNA